MNFTNIALVLMIIAVFNLVTSQSPPRCVDIPVLPVNYQDMVKFSPLFVYQTTESEFNCSQIIFVNFAGRRSDYTGSILVLNPNKTITYDFTLVEGGIFEDLRCSDGLRFDYRIIFYDYKSFNEASYCAVVCDSTGDKIQVVFCAGRNGRDAFKTGRFMGNVRTPFVKDYFYSQQNCPQPQHCATLF